MQTMTPHTDYNRLMDAAHARALRLRRQAIASFWDEVGAAAARAIRGLRRGIAGQVHHRRVEA